MNKLTAIILAVCCLSTSSITAYADSAANAATSVTVDISLPEGVPGFLIVDEVTLKQALANASYSILPIQNDIDLVSGVPLTLDDNRKCKLVSATGEPVAIHQTVSNIRHFYFNRPTGIELTFEDVILEGDDVGGGVDMRGWVESYTARGDVKITNAVIQNCKANSGGGVYLACGELTLKNTEISNNTAVKGGGVYTTDGNSTFDMRGGKIAGNTATGDGGGVHNYTGTFLLSDVDISGNTAASGMGGGIYSEHVVSLNEVTISENTAVNGGGVALSRTNCDFSVNGGVIRDNTATVNGGGVYVTNTAPTNCFNLAGDITFSGNTACKAYWIEKDSTHMYNDQMATFWKDYYDSDIRPYVISLSDAPVGCVEFDYGYNNYDLNYVGSTSSSVSPGTDKLVFDASTSIANFEYEAVVSSTDQLCNLKGAKPVINVYNTTGNLWKLKLSYSTFTASNTEEPDIQFALRSSDGTYTTFQPSTPQTIYRATEAWGTDFITTVPWGTGTDDLLKVKIPKNRYDLAREGLGSEVSWVLEIEL